MPRVRTLQTHRVGSKTHKEGAEYETYQGNADRLVAAGVVERADTPDSALARAEEPDDAPAPAATSALQKGGRK